jgi:preprotein translocase subunit SecG
MTVLFFIFLFIFLALCAIVCFTILIQEAKSLGLGASFGGDAGDSVFGTSTAEVLKKFTAYVVGIFMISCIVLSMWSGSLGRNPKAPIPTTIEEAPVKR